MMGIPPKNLGLALLLLIGFGLARLPVERSMDTTLRDQEFLDNNVDLPLLDNLGQSGFAAALGGFRSLVASYLYIKSNTDGFEHNKWEKVDQQYGIITTLKPRTSHYWDQYVWHIGWNAYSHTMRDADYERRHGSEMKAWNYENITAPGYLDRAEQIALKSVTMVDDDYRLYQRLGQFYNEKRDDNCSAAEWYRRGSKVEGAPRYMHRIYAIYLAKCPGSEELAYELISKRYWGDEPQERSLSVRIYMEELEDKLALKELAEKGADGVRVAIAAEPDNYLHKAALAHHYLTDLKQPDTARDIYDTMLTIAAKTKKPIPAFYKKKWALLAAQAPGLEVVAYETLREVLHETRRRLTTEEAAIVRPLEERLEIPMEMRIFGGKESVKPPNRLRK